MGQGELIGITADSPCS